MVIYCTIASKVKYITCLCFLRNIRASFSFSILTDLILNNNRIFTFDPVLYFQITIEQLPQEQNIAEIRNDALRHCFFENIYSIKRNQTNTIFFKKQSVADYKVEYIMQTFCTFV